MYTHRVRGLSKGLQIDVTMSSKNDLLDYLGQHSFEFDFSTSKELLRHHFPDDVYDSIQGDVWVLDDISGHLDGNVYMDYTAWAFVPLLESMLPSA